MTSKIKCTVCGNETPKKGARQKYCPDCAHKVDAKRHIQYKKNWINKNKEYYRNQQKIYRRRKRAEENETVKQIDLVEE